MAPKVAPTFKTPDGREFQTRTEYRDYMMKTFYSWKGLKNEPSPRMKGPGELEGNVFDMSDCTGCTLVLLDSTEAVQLDGLVKCRVFIGCCVSSTFIRNCDSCIFYTCSRQLRLREVTASTLYVYSQAEVHIEQSSGLAFAPFNGGYAEQKQHFEAAGLDASANLWYDIFDHNDPAKTRRNWRLLKEESHEAPWFPQGTACTPCVAVTAPGAAQGVDGASQVGEAFGMDQMMADAKRMEEEAAADASHKLSMETALLVASALGKGINVSLWLTEGASQSTQPLADFEAKLISLGLTVGVEEDWDTKRELEAATSKSALRAIAAACGRGRDKSGAELLDVGLFIRAAEAKVAAYLEAAEGDGALDEEDEEVEEELDEELAQEDEDEDEDEDGREPEAAARPSKAAASSGSGRAEANGRPASAGASRVERAFASTTLPPRSPSNATASTSANASPSPNTLAARRGPSTPTIVVPADATEALIPDSPYDEEVAFDLEGDDEVETVLQGLSQRPASAHGRLGGRSATSPPGRSARGSDREALFAARPSAEGERQAVRPRAALQPPRPSSAGPRQARQVIARSASAGHSRSSSLLQASLSAPPPARFNAAEDAEDRVRYAVRTTDFYHLVQLHLGLISADHSMMPPRGAAVCSVPRPWLSIRDIKDAFAAARVNFSDATVLAIMHNVLAFAERQQQQQQQGQGGGAGGGALVSASDVICDDGHGNKLSAEHLKAYLVHLRLTKKSRPAPPPDPWAHPNASSASAFISAARDGSTGHSASSSGLSSARASGGTHTGSVLSEHGRRMSAPGAGAGQGQGPLQWKDWLGRKCALDEQARSDKPKEFIKALAGRAHRLSPDELLHMLEANEIIPPESMKTEISQRVRAWALDMHGRMDFLHALHLERRRHQQEHKVSWRAVPEAQRRALEADMKRRLVTAKTEALYASERDGVAITRELYAKFEAECRALRHSPALVVNWGVWLGRRHAKVETGIRRFKEDQASRAKACQDRQSRLRTVAPLVEVEAQLLKAAETMNTIHSVELRKSLVQLRRTCLEGQGSTRARRAGSSGAAPDRGLLISKRAFERHLDKVLAPRLLELPQDMRPLAQEARRSHDGLGAHHARSPDSPGQACAPDTLFLRDEAEATARMQALQEERERLKAEEFGKWTRDKREQRAGEAERRRAAEEARAKAADRQKRVAQRAFRNWCRLRKDNKYVSKVVVPAPETAEEPRPTARPQVKKVVRSVPDLKRVSHDLRWNKEAELPGYTYER